MKILAAIILYGLFFLVCFLGTGSDEKNIRSFYSYPDEIQELVRESGKYKIPEKTSYAVSLLSNTAVFTIVFVIIGMLIQEDSFWYFLLLGEGLNLFDLLVIDLLWWQHSKRIRFSGIGRSEDYLGLPNHVHAFLRAIPVFAAAAGLAALILGHS